MKVYISVDCEGIGGIVDPDQIGRGQPFYSEGRELVTAETNAAVEGAFAGGATAVVVNDSHGSMRNIIAEKLDPRAELISGSFKTFSMVHGLNATFDAALFIGYHGRQGTRDAVMDHTYFPKEVHRIWLNGTEAGETLINGAMAGYYGVPVVLVSGDKSTGEQAKALIPGVHTVAVKEGIGRYAAKSVHPSVARKMVRDGVQVALRDAKKIKPLTLSTPVTLEIEFTAAVMADLSVMVPGVERVSDRKVRFVHTDYKTVFQCMMVLLRLASVAYHEAY